MFSTTKIIVLIHKTVINGSFFTNQSSAEISAVLIDIYMTIPTISFVIEIKGPVANAGSILKRSRVKGTNVPNTEANITTANSDSDTATVVT